MICAVAALVVHVVALGHGRARAAVVEWPGRVRAGGFVDGRAVVDTGGGPRQRPQLLGDVGFDAAFGRALAARLELRGRFGGPIEGGSGAAVGNFGDAFQNHSPLFDVPEAWVEARSRHLDVRVGLQRFAWGKLDGIPPTDVVSPRDWHDPFVDDYEERKLCVPAVSTTAYLPDVPRLLLSGLRASVIAIPFAVPPRLPLVQERWFPPSVTSLGLPLRLRSPDGARGVLTDARFATRNDAPSRRWATGGIALRFGGTVRNVDWDLYYYDGPENGPDLRLEPFVRLRSCPQRADADFCLAGLGRFAQTFDTVRMTGADLAMPVGGFTVRLEAAYFDDRSFLRRGSDVLDEIVRGVERRGLPQRRLAAGRAIRLPASPLFPPVDAVEWGIGADYLWRGWQPLVQLVQVVPVEDAPRLLVADPETRVSGTVRRRFFADRVEVELRGQWALEREAWFVYPRVAYRLWDAVRVRVGYLALGGQPASLIGQFHANDEVTFEARYTF